MCASPDLTSPTSRQNAGSTLIAALFVLGSMVRAAQPGDRVRLFALALVCAAGDGSWDVLRHLGRDRGEHAHNAHNAHNGQAATGAGAHLKNGHAPRRGSADR